MLPPLSSAPSRLLPRRTVASATAATASSPSPAPSPAGGHGHRPLRYAVLGAGFAGLSVAWHLLKVTLHFPSSSSLPVGDTTSRNRLNRRWPDFNFQHSPRDSRVSVDIYDENGVGGGASGVSGGLLHPYSPKGPSSIVSTKPSESHWFRTPPMATQRMTWHPAYFISVMRLNSLLTTVKLLWRGAEFWKESMDLLRSAEQANRTMGSDTTNEDDNLIWRRQCIHYIFAATVICSPLLLVSTCYIFKESF